MTVISCSESSSSDVEANSYSSFDVKSAETRELSVKKKLAKVRLTQALRVTLIVIVCRHLDSFSLNGNLDLPAKVRHEIKHGDHRWQHDPILPHQFREKHKGLVEVGAHLKSKVKQRDDALRMY